jgi:chromosome segregation ATPase
MNKEETIKQLTELQSRLDSEVDNYNIDNRVEEIEQITARIEKNNAILKYYAEQLADDKNFIDETPLQYYLMLEAQELENLKAKQAAERENQDRILIEGSIIASSEATILAGQEEIAKLGVDNTQLSIDIRRARLSSNKEKVDACESKIDNNNKRIQEIETQIGTIQTSIEQHTSVIESLNGLTDNLKEQTAEAKAKYDDVVAQEKASKNGEIDLAKKNKAEAELESLKTITSTLEQRSTAISYDYAGELKNIITDYTNSEINDEEMKAKLSELKTKLPEDFIKSDETARNAEISENQRVQEILEVKIDNLKSKLDNEDNYKVSPAQYAKIRAKLSACKKNMSSYDSQIAMLNSQIPSNELDLNEYQEMIDLCNDENEEIARQLILNNGVDKDLEAELTAKQKMNFTIIAEANELIENVNVDGLENTQVLAQLEERKARTEKLIASYQAELADENALDRSKIRLDQVELANCIQGLNALKNREQFLNNSIIVTIDNIIGGKLVNNNGVEINTNSNNSLPFATSDGFNPEDMTFNDSQNISPIPVGEVNANDPYDFENLNPNGFGASDDDLNLFGIENPASKTDENEKIEEINTSEVNENLKNKSKLDKFKTAFKKHWRKVAIVVALMAALAAGLKSCDQNKVDKATDAIINNDDAMEDVIDSQNPDNSLQDFLDRNGLTIEDNKQDTTNPVNETEKAKPTSNENNGNSSAPYTEKAPETKEAPCSSSTINNS